MEYKSIKGFTGWAQMGFLFAFLGLGFILAGGVQLLLTLQILPKGVSITDTDAVMKAMLAPENVGMARTIQVLGTMVLLFIPALLWNFVSNGKSLFWIGFNKHINIFQILLGFMIIFAASIAAAPLADITKKIISHFPTINASAKSMEDLYNQQAIALSNLKSFSEYLVALAIMAFFPAMFEEVFFRGVVQNLLTKWWRKPILAIIVTAAIFSLIHMSIYLFLVRMVLGIVLGLLFYKTKNIWVNIIAHFLNNMFALTQLYTLQKMNKPIDVSKLDPDVHWSVGLLGIAALAGLFMLLKKYSAKNVAKIDAAENVLIAYANPYSGITNNNENKQ